MDTALPTDAITEPESAVSLSPYGNRQLERVPLTCAVELHGTLRSLDPAKLFDSPWCRIETLDQGELNELAGDIQAAGKNEIPVLVHTKADGALEVVFGARRVQACRQLEILVVAQCIDFELSALEVFRLQEIENRSRSAVSAYENAKRYSKALSEGLFPSQRKLAEYIGKSQPWISAVLPLLALPLEVVKAFDHLNDLQPDHAGELQVAMVKDLRGVLYRATEFVRLRDTQKRRSAKETMRYLLGVENPASEEWQPLDHCGRKVGRWKCNKKGETTVRISRKLDPDEIAAIAKLAAAESTEQADKTAKRDK